MHNAGTLLCINVCDALCTCIVVYVRTYVRMYIHFYCLLVVLRMYTSIPCVQFLSRAFRNRFIELHFEEIPAPELVTILHCLSGVPESYAKKMVAIMQDLQVCCFLSQPLGIVPLSTYCSMIPYSTYCS